MPSATIALYGLIPDRNTFHNESERLMPFNRCTICWSVLVVQYPA